MTNTTMIRASREPAPGASDHAGFAGVWRALGTAAPVLVSAAAAAACIALGAPPAGAQQQPAGRTIDFSGVLYPQFRYATDPAAKAANGGNAASRFDLERVYLTFRMPAGDRGNVRVTTDVFNNGTACTGCYAGWSVRMKYAYFHYDLLDDIGGHEGFNAALRLGMQQTVVVEHVEGFWPRWISSVAAERNGFFSSSDVGVAALVTLPRSLGDAYLGLANGSGYATAENDPYKDWSARLTLTPWGSRTGVLRTVAVSPWIYGGRSASKFLSTPGAAGTDVADGLRKNRAGVFVGIRDRRLTAGAEWARRMEAVESGSTLATRTTADNDGTLTSAFVLARPLELLAAEGRRSRLTLMARVDRFSPFSNPAAAGAQTTDARNDLLIAGAVWDLNQRASFSLDLQHLRPQGGSTTTESRILFLHGQVTF